MTRHDRDAGGDPGILEAKARLREEVWGRLEREGVARFPGAEGRIPNFAGAGDAAERLRNVPHWTEARALKANPDYPQLPVRKRALRDGKVVYMAVPRLAEPEPFLLLDPDRLDESPHRAASIKGAARDGRRVTVNEVEPVDLVVTGCVAVDRSGARLGKGGGFSDLEYAVALEAGLIGPDTPVVTTVHPLQVLEEERIPMTGHDVRLDWIVTPEEVIRVENGASVGERSHGSDNPDASEDLGPDRLPGIRWEELTEEKIESIPLLRRLRRGADRED